jgi:wobble nucleotide-excising tRNase
MNRSVHYKSSHYKLKIMITSLTLKNVATYDSSGVIIGDLKKINFIYGANGSGKTTISKLLHDSTQPGFSSCSLNWAGGGSMSILVFNRDFKERNFGKGKLEGVFTLGEASKDDIRIIDKKLEELQLILNFGEQNHVILQSQLTMRRVMEDDFRDEIWKRVYKKYESTYKNAFIGFLTKENFKNKILQEANKATLTVLSNEDLNEKANTIFGKQQNKIQRIILGDFGRLIEIENNPIWRKVIVGKSNVNISKLIHRLNLNDWVNHGRTFIQHENDTCPFCQQDTLNVDFRQQLEDFFDETYTNELSTVLSLKKEYNALTAEMLGQLGAIESSQNLFTSTKLDIEKYSAILETLVSQVAVNSELVNNKLKEPSRSLQMVSLKEQLDNLGILIKEANLSIDKHNFIIDNFKSEKLNLIQDIWRFLVTEFRSMIDTFNYERTVLSSAIDLTENQLMESKSKYDLLDDEIKNLSKNVTSIQPTIDEINRQLKLYGFLNFKIVPSIESGFYQIRRDDGSIAEPTLSEGEIAFVTFLYFLQVANGGISEVRVNEERVLVIDDPVSSLDFNILFVVSSFIKEIINRIKNGVGNIKQLILLTHNIHFHKEVSFVDRRRSSSEESHFWILRKHGNITSVEPFFVNNPIQSSYALLWAELRRDNLNPLVSIRHTMRRIIENYFRLMGEYLDDKIINRFASNEEREICGSLLSWSHDGPLKIHEDLSVDLRESTAGRYKMVFREIFVATNHEKHYDMMMGVHRD